MLRPEEWPKTVEEAVDQLISSMSEEDKEALRNTPEQDLILFHHGFGTYLRNEFGLRSDSNELLKSCGSRISPESAYDEYLAMIVDPDSASTEIIEATWKKLQQE